MIGEEIGRGQFGIVYKAIHKTSGEFVAIKTLNMRLVPLSQREDVLVRTIHNTRSSSRGAREV